MSFLFFSSCVVCVRFATTSCRNRFSCSRTASSAPGSTNVNSVLYGASRFQLDRLKIHPERSGEDHRFLRLDKRTITVVTTALVAQGHLLFSSRRSSLGAGVINARSLDPNHLLIHDCISEYSLDFLAVAECLPFVGCSEWLFRACYI